MANIKKTKRNDDGLNLHESDSKKMISDAFDEYQDMEFEDDFEYDDEDLAGISESYSDFLKDVNLRKAEYGNKSFVLFETLDDDFVRLIDKAEFEAAIEKESFADYIDHTILKADATRDDIIKLCAEAREHRFASVCVNGYWVKLVKELLRGSGVKTCAVVGFPLGAMATAVKTFEACTAFKDGADEVDMVINIGALKSGDYDTVARDIHSIVSEGAIHQGVVKVIIEACLLTEDEKETACLLAKLCRAHFVKTSTGFSTGGATVADVELMKRVVEDDVFVKASGGIRSLADMEKMIEAGADRIGTSSGVKILAEFAANQKSEKKK